MIYHVFSKSIADFVIFGVDSDFLRMIGSVRYYQIEKPLTSFSRFIEFQKSKKHTAMNKQVVADKKENLVSIIGYCVMPTHIHLILKELKEKGISIFMSNILNSYTRYFNIKHHRKGPLWEGRFKRVLVKSDEQLLHLTRYIHLNPVTAYLVDKPEKWSYSSYGEYLLKVKNKDRLCSYEDVLEITPNSYKIFVEDRISYQRDLAKIKRLTLE